MVIHNKTIKPETCYFYKSPQKWKAFVEAKGSGAKCSAGLIFAASAMTETALAGPKLVTGTTQHHQLDPWHYEKWQRASLKSLGIWGVANMAVGGLLTLVFMSCGGVLGSAVGLCVGVLQRLDGKRHPALGRTIECACGQGVMVGFVAGNTLFELSESLRGLTHVIFDQISWASEVFVEGELVFRLQSLKDMRFGPPEMGSLLYTQNKDLGPIFSSEDHWQ